MTHDERLFQKYLVPASGQDQKEMSVIVDRLVDVYRPLRVYLFGSYVWGTPSTESDYDLCVVVETIQLLTVPFTTRSNVPKKHSKDFSLSNGRKSGRLTTSPS